MGRSVRTQSAHACTRLTSWSSDKQDRAADCFVVYAFSHSSSTPGQEAPEMAGCCKDCKDDCVCCDGCKTGKGCSCSPDNCPCKKCPCCKSECC
ncbi:hypothetical protein AAHC03_026132 [Spirometra sp. Aus1]